MFFGCFGGSIQYNEKGSQVRRFQGLFTRTCWTFVACKTNIRSVIHQAYYRIYLAECISSCKGLPNIFRLDKSCSHNLNALFLLLFSTHLSAFLLLFLFVIQGGKRARNLICPIWSQSLCALCAYNCLAYMAALARIMIVAFSPFDKLSRNLFVKRLRSCFFSTSLALCFFRQVAL